MKLLNVVFASILCGSAAFADVVKSYQGQSSLPPSTCEFSLRTSDSGEVRGYSLKGPGEMVMNFGICANTCVYPDMASDMLNPAEFQRYGFRVILSKSYPQISLVSRFVKEQTDMIFISRKVEVDLNEAGAADEVRFQEFTEVGPTPTVAKYINCDHLKEVTEKPTKSSR